MNSPFSVWGKEVFATIKIRQIARMFTAPNSTSGQTVDIVSSKVVPLIITIIIFFSSSSSPSSLGTKSPSKKTRN
jgi:hypothetical protein